ncbi:MAG: hypothetical protein HW382_622 [Deltaproteobacteria bacterium]|nr:hypothetical protein [Deltaproteobacteria bacterium]
MAEGQSNWSQGFFDQAPEIRLKDPLAYILGAMEADGVMVFKYPDAVKMAGHSCAAVSGAYMVTVKALKALYGDDIPVRSQITVLIKGGPTDLAYGPMAQVISLITGAAGNTGFKGLGRVGGRQNKLVFDDKDFQFNTFIFQRDDTGRSVKVTYNPQVLPQNPDMGDLMPLVVSGKASKEERDQFVAMWQGNVKKVLLEPDKYPGLFEIEEIKI